MGILILTGMHGKARMQNLSESADSAPLQADLPGIVPDQFAGRIYQVNFEVANGAEGGKYGGFKMCGRQLYLQ